MLIILPRPTVNVLLFRHPGRRQNGTDKGARVGEIGLTDSEKANNGQTGREGERKARATPDGCVREIDEAI
jgi:hypothetical protein